MPKPKRELDGANGLKQFFGRTFFEEVTFGAGLGHVQDILTGIVDGEDEYFGLGVVLSKLADDFEAIHFWHIDIEKNQVGMILCRQGDGLLAGGGFANDFDLVNF